MLTGLRRLFGGQTQAARSQRPPRYATLEWIFERDCVRKDRILEVGTYHGDTAVALVRIARRHTPPAGIHYYGFDLFETLDHETYRRETSKRPTRTMADVGAGIADRGGIPPDHVHLYRGFTRDTLWAALPDLPPMGLIFIDGGHSEATVDNDWRACRRLMDRDTVVVFDDYYHFDYGPRRVIDRLDRREYEVEVLEPRDVFPDPFGISPDRTLAINLVKVTRRRGRA